MASAKSNKIILLLTTTLVSYLLTGILLLGLAFLLYKFKLSNRQIQTGVYLIYVVGCFIGGIAAGKKAGSRRFLWGLLTGLIYFSVLFLVSSLMGKPLESGSRHLIIVLLVCLGSGTAGGMVS